MWIPLQNRNQLILGSRLRLTLLDGDFEYESIFRVIRIGNIGFLAELYEANGRQIAEEWQSVIPYRLDNLLYYGFSIFVPE